MKKHIQNGFTLYELLITVLIIGVVLTIGVPNLGDFTRNSRITGTTNDLHGSFFLARSEAARAKESVTICASADPTGAALCDGAGFDEGWIIFNDIDPADAERTVAEEHVLKAFPPVHDSVDIATGNGATYFSFAPTGLGQTIAAAGPAFQIAMICDDRGNVLAPGGNSAARRVVVTPIGRSTIISSVETITASGDSC